VRARKGFNVDEIKTLLGSNQVVVVAGDTGSGKTTQLPKIALAAGFGVGGMIGHTQPRRLAARAVANRVAEELGTEVGSTNPRLRSTLQMRLSSGSAVAATR